MSKLMLQILKRNMVIFAPDVVGVTELTSPYFFVPPSGTTAERPSDCTSAH